MNPECFLCLEGEFPELGEDISGIRRDSVNQTISDIDSASSTESLIKREPKHLMPLVVSGCDCHPWVHPECLQEWVNVRQEHCCPICRRDGTIEGMIYPDESSSFMWNLWGGVGGGSGGGSGRSAPRVTAGSYHQVQWDAFGGQVRSISMPNAPQDHVGAYIEMGQHPNNPPLRNPQVEANAIISERNSLKRSCCLSLFILTSITLVIIIISMGGSSSH